MIKKLKKAALKTGIKHIAISGGVSANSALRTALEETGKTEGWQTYIPAFQYCTDNAGMIGVAAYYQYLAGISPTKAWWLLLDCKQKHETSMIFINHN